MVTWYRNAPDMPSKGGHPDQKTLIVLDCALEAQLITSSSDPRSFQVNKGVSSPFHHHDHLR